MIEDLAACDKVTVASEKQASTVETVSDTVGSHATIYLPLPPELKKAHEIDLAKLEKKRTKLLEELRKMQSMTSAESYRINAAAKVQQAHAKKVSRILLFHYLFIIFKYFLSIFKKIITPWCL